MIWALLGLAAGGVLKGATGAGAPLIAVPVLAMAYDMQRAVTLFALVSVVSNFSQVWKYSGRQLPWRFTLALAGMGAVGAGVGTLMLANLPSDTLLLLAATVVFLYLAFRLTNPHWILSYDVGRWLAWPMGFLGGLLQGATGVSAPISISFLSALRLERAVFISTISTFFLGLAVVQIPMLVVTGLLTWASLASAALAMAVLLGAMPLGEILARHLSKETFDRILLVLLAAIGLRMVWSGLT